MSAELPFKPVNELTDEELILEAMRIFDLPKKGAPKAPLSNLQRERFRDLLVAAHSRGWHLCQPWAGNGGNA